MARSSQSRGVRIIAVILVIAMLISFATALILAVSTS